jgi:hypothetical protein
MEPARGGSDGRSAQVSRRLTHRLLGAFAVSGALLSGLPAATAQPAGQPSVIAALPVTVVLVRVIGPWTQPDGRGISRVVAIADGTRMRLFVQWIADAPEGAVLADSREVPEVAEEGLVFGDVRVEASENDASVFLDTLPQGGMKETYVLLVQGPGEFKFGPATN